MQTGVLNIDDTEDSKVFSKDDMGSEDLDPGRTICLFPFESVLQHGPRDELKLWQPPVIDSTILFLTLPLGVDASVISIALRSRKSAPLFITKTLPLSSSASGFFSERSKLSHELTPRPTK